MKLTIKFFGMAAEAVQNSEQGVNLAAPTTAQALLEHLSNAHPQLRDMPLRVAVNQQLVSNEYVIEADAEIAVLPPFAGG